MNDDQTYSTKECTAVLKLIFEGADTLYSKIAPYGWKNSEYVTFLHPRPEQQYEEHLRMSRNIARLSKKEDEEDINLSFSDFQQSDLNEIDEYDEFIYVLGLAVYDIFSNNHEVIGNDSKIYDLGSARGSGSFLANFLEHDYPRQKGAYDYMDFYMGSIWIESRGDLSPFYTFIFQKLREADCDWNYYFPRLHVIDFGKNNDPSNTSKPEDYTPENAVIKQLEANEKEKQFNKLKEELDKAHYEAYENAKYEAPTPLAEAYRKVYGHLPKGHPQRNI